MPKQKIITVIASALTIVHNTMLSSQKLFFSFCFCFFFLLPLPVFCEEVFVFHFEKNTDNALVLKTGNSPSIEKKEDPEFSIVDFIKNPPQQGEYRMELYDVSGSLIDVFLLPNTSSSFSYTIPYFSIANRYKVYDTKTGTLSLDGSIASFVACNDNGICEYEKNENADTCVSDCGSHAVYSEKTQEILQKNGILPEKQPSQPESRSSLQTQENPPFPETTTPTAKSSTQNKTVFSPIFIALLAGIFLLVFGGTFFLIWRVIRK